MNIEQNLADRVADFRNAERNMQQTRFHLMTAARACRRAGWSAQKIATFIGVSKRTIQLWTDE